VNAWIRQPAVNQEAKQAIEMCRCGGSLRLVRFLFAFVIAAMVSAGCAHHTYTTSAPAPPPSASGQPSSTVPSAGAPPASAASGPPPAVENQPAIPGQYVENGVASWYGVPFDGRRTSNGEIYDMHQMTAAHRTLPFGAIVRVTNLSNGKQVEVRINDRGPFVANRVIDLSLSAAKAIDMWGPGTAQVRLEIVGGPNQQGGFFGVQVGAFRDQGNAERLRGQLDSSYPPAIVVPYDSPTGMFYRVRVGRLPTEDAAQHLADQLHQNEQFTTFVVRLDN
jgi:rare lipoprotein A